MHTNSAASDINLPTFRLTNKCSGNIAFTDYDGNRYLWIPTAKGFFNIAKCEILIDGKVPDRDGLVPDAVFFSNEEVAQLIAESDARTRRLENIESLLGEWIEQRRSKLRKIRKGSKHSITLQKKEMEVSK